MKYFIIIAAALGLAAGSGGTLLITKAVKPKIEIPACPPCNCPPAAVVELGNFDMDKLNNRRGNFTFAPNFQNPVIYMNCVDSVHLKPKKK